MIMRHRPATEADVRQWFGHVPATMRAIVIEVDGEVLGIAGIGKAADHLQAFSAFKESMRGHTVAMARAALEMKRMLMDAPGPVLAVCSQSEPTAPALLKRMGFVQIDDRRWVHG